MARSSSTMNDSCSFPKTLLLKAAVPLPFASPFLEKLSSRGPGCRLEYCLAIASSAETPSKLFKLGYTSSGNLAANATASPPNNLSGKASGSVTCALDGLKATVAASLRFESFVRTISRGVPGLTRAALRYSVPRSIPRTAEAAKAGVEKRSRTKRGSRYRQDGTFLRPGGDILQKNPKLEVAPV